MSWFGRIQVFQKSWPEKLEVIGFILDQNLTLNSVSEMTDDGLKLLCGTLEKLESLRELSLHS